MKEEWFQTWDRPEYQEWAMPIVQGYMLYIVRKENARFLVVQAKLIMGQQGLPGFEVIEQCYHPSQEEALQQIHSWVNCVASSRSISSAKFVNT